MDGFTISNSNRFLETGNLKLNQSTQAEVNPSVSSPGVSGDKSFADTLKDAITEVNNLQQVSNQKMQELAVGKTDNVADVMIAAEKADIAMRVMVQVRNKVIDAYNEIMRMNV
jgi:flagellar hook-basal body complex protein FliE